MTYYACIRQLLNCVEVIFQFTIGWAWKKPPVSATASLEKNPTLFEHRICVVFTALIAFGNPSSPTVRAENSGGETSWAVSYEILVPRSTNLKLKTHNGGIGINGVEGIMELEALNGGISLSDVAGDVKGKTMNGGVSVVLSGSSWRGAGLDVGTTNGGVHLTVPDGYAAHVETRTVNGGFTSDISQLTVERKERNTGINISANINGGGAPIRVVTTNGGVKISSSTKNL